MIRIDRIWLAVDPMDMRAGLEATLARVVRVFGAAHPHHAYVFANRRATRMELSDEQIGALVLGLPWQRLGAAGTIDRI